MDLNIIYIGIIIILLIFTTRNFLLLRDLRGSKGYRNIYQAVIHKETDVINKLEEYIKEEKNDYLLNKAYVLLMYVKLPNNDDVGEVIEKIDYTKIFLKNGKYNKQFVNINSDMIIWTLCCFPRLKKIKKLSLIKEKFDTLQDQLSNHVEYRVFNGAYAVMNNNIEESKFLNELVNGEYSGLDYDKQLIAVTKRIALAYIACQSKEKKNIEYADELKTLSNSMLGKSLLMDLDIYEVYK